MLCNIAYLYIDCIYIMHLQYIAYLCVLSAVYNRASKASCSPRLRSDGAALTLSCMLAYLYALCGLRLMFCSCST